MKISQLKAARARNDEGAAIAVKDENGDPYMAGDGTTPVMITVVGPYSERIRAVRERQQKRLLKKARKELTPEEIHERQIEVATAAIIDWAGFEAEDGTPIPFTPENAREVLTAAPWIQDQVEEAVNAHASFFGKS
jgi:hypothetical protein